MTPALIQILLFASEEILKEAPALFSKIAATFSKEDVGLADLQALRAEIAGQKYEDFVPATQLPSINPPTLTQPVQTSAGAAPELPLPPEQIAPEKAPSAVGKRPSINV